MTESWLLWQQTNMCSKAIVFLPMSCYALSRLSKKDLHDSLPATCGRVVTNDADRPRPVTSMTFMSPSCKPTQQSMKMRYDRAATKTSGKQIKNLISASRSSGLIVAARQLLLYPERLPCFVWTLQAASLPPKTVLIEQHSAIPICLQCRMSMQPAFLREWSSCRHLQLRQTHWLAVQAGRVNLRA